LPLQSANFAFLSFPPLSSQPPAMQQQQQPLEPNEANLKALVGVLQATLDGQTIKAASAQLQSLDGRPQFSLCLLQLISMPSVTDMALKQAAAIAFKNFVLRNWAYEGSEAQEKGQPDMIKENDRTLIKQHIVPLMVSQPKAIQQQLSQSLAIISQMDFPDKWPTLLPELVGRFATCDSKPDELLGVLEVMNSIFYRYRIELKSDKLWMEIAKVWEAVCQPLSDLFLKWVVRLSDPAHKSNAQTLPIIVGILALILENFFSLNSQELAQEFEGENKETLRMWFGNCLELLAYTNSILEPRDQDEPTRLDSLKATICDIINLFTWKYEDQFAQFVPQYMTAIWALITSLSDAKRFDHLVNSAMKFLTSVAKKEHFKALFGNEGVLPALCVKVIVPQLKLRESDIELFEFNSQDYIRFDIEGSDVDTRRRTSLDFIHGITQHYEAQVTQILKQYVDALLAEYTASGNKKFISKDAAMYIILALAPKKSSLARGVTEINPHIDLLAFMQQNVIPELLASNSANHDIIKADCLKFVSIFRQQLPKDYYAQLIPILTRYMASDSVVVHTYAAYAVERLLSVKDGSELRFNKSSLQPHLQKLLEGLFAVLDHAESKENEYVMRAIMRVCSVGQDTMVSFAEVIIGKITAILGYVSQNPRNPKFNHSMFETIAALVKYLCKTNPSLVDAFQTALFSPFQSMLGMESAVEFSPYVFQILAQLLELRADISAPYVAIFPNLLMPALWSNTGNVPAITRLLQAYLTKKGVWEALFEGKPYWMGVLGICQELLRLKSTEAYSLELLTSIIVDLDLKHTGKDLVTAFRTLLFPKLQPTAKPTPRIFKGTVVLIFAFIAKHGFETVVGLMNQVHQGVFGGLYGDLLVNKVILLNSESERKLGAVVLTTLLKHPAFLQDQSFLALWPKTFLAASKCVAPKPSKDAASLSALNAHAAGLEEDDPDDLLQQSEKGFSTAYAKLVFSGIPERDFLPEVPSGAEFFKSNIAALCAQHPGKFPQMLGALPQEDQQFLQSFLTQYKVAMQ
jgi:exportin-2 (importin alpha re-exporter)